MFNNIGAKIKGLATVITAVGIFAGVVVFFVMMSADDDMLLMAFVTGAAICLASWVGSFVLYGFGELVEAAVRCADALDGRDEKKAEKANEYKTPIGEEGWCCDDCGYFNDIDCTCCHKCEREKNPTEVPYECGKCGFPGPYGEECPICGNSVKKHKS